MYLLKHESWTSSDEIGKKVGTKFVPLELNTNVLILQEEVSQHWQPSYFSPSFSFKIQPVIASQE